jgi:Tfp pilus assembly protein PilX
VKRDEKQRLETELREEEMALQKAESVLRLAEQAFDQFLQENDRKAVGAMKRYVCVTRKTTTLTTRNVIENFPQVMLYHLVVILCR